MVGWVWALDLKKKKAKEWLLCRSWDCQRLSEGCQETSKPARLASYHL